MISEEEQYKLHTIKEHEDPTKFSEMEDEMDAEEQDVWFGA